MPETLNFPAPTNIQINMMPFVMGDPSSLPPQLHAYLPFVEQALQVVPGERGKIGYITIEESWVEAGATHRRSGLHTDRHPDAMRGGVGIPTQWGGNIAGRGGIFLGSNVANSCAIWDLDVDEPGPHGNCEHLRESLLEEGVKPRVMLPSRLYWMSDTIPHESLPLKERTFRQFFRLVTSRVSHWFKKNSTANPLGIVPPPNCQIVLCDKFENWSPQNHHAFGDVCQELFLTHACAMYRLMDTQYLLETDPALIEATLEQLRRCDILEGDAAPSEQERPRRKVARGLLHGMITHL